jgi:hypothetical protein
MRALYGLPATASACHPDSTQVNARAATTAVVVADVADVADDCDDVAAVAVAVAVVVLMRAFR